ncbi:hypothetical protein [Paracoccus denitrificans]|uniref:hypothetical protein n=1 Tax=Paracoccus denitrificans TaxID=266 RepID=UPI000CEC8893|nr:hypothetical protein [Paracoccus denitrificans]UFS67184.1 hypothetical protein LO749_13725 [Paracoccus denitrificans]
MDAYGHLRILVSMILGLGITRVLSGLSRRIQSPVRSEGMLAQMIWALIVLLGAVHFWWWEFGLRHISDWYFGAYIFVLCYASLHFVMATLIFPDAPLDHAESESFFMDRRGWFFAVFALTFGFDLLDTLIKSREYLQGLGPEYFLRLILGLCTAFAALRARTLQGVALVGAVWLAYDISWILRKYDSLQ